MSSGTHVTVIGQDAAESAGGSAMRELQSDHRSEVVGDVPRFVHMLFIFLNMY